MGRRILRGSFDKQRDDARPSMRGVVACALRLSLLASTALVLIAAPAAAQTAQIWTGNGSDDWFNVSNWDSGSAPVPGDSVTLDTVTPNPARIDGLHGAYGPIDLTALNVGFLDTGALTIINGASFTVTNGLAVIGGDMGGVATGASGSVVLDGAGTSFTVTGAPPGSGMLVVGASGTGAFTVQNGAALNTVDSYVGHLGTGVGTATVTGAGSQWNNSGNIYIGNYGTGVVNVQNGATVTTAFTTVGEHAGSTGTLNVSGTGSSWTTVLTLLGGQSSPGGTGIINVSDGGSYTSSGAVAFGFRPGSTGIINVTSGATFTVNSNASIYVGAVSGAIGALIVDGAGSAFDASAGGDMHIGGINSPVAAGTGVVTVRNGGTLIAENATYLGSGTSGGDGTLNADGAGTTVTLNGAATGDALFVGYTGNGAMNITNGAQVTTNGFAYLGNFAGATGTVTIDGAGSTWTSTAPVIVIGGNQSGADPGGTGIINVRNGGTLNTNDAALGIDSTNTSVGTVNVTGAGSTWNANDIFVGYDSVGIVNVTNGGRINASSMFIGDCLCSNGTVNISGGSTVALFNDLFVGNDGAGALDIRGGSTLTVGNDLYIGVQLSSSMTVSGPGTSVTVANALYLALAADSTLTIENGASVRAPGVALGPLGAGYGTLTVTGAGSLLSADTLVIGSGSDSGALNILDSGRVDVTNLALSEGKITVGAGSALTAGTFGLSPTATTTFGLRGSAFGQIVVNGAFPTALDGALVVTGRNVARTTYTLLTSADLGGSTFASVTFDPLLRNPVLTYTLGDVLLTVDQFFLSSIVPSNAGTNQRNVAQALDAAITAGATPSLALENIFFLSGPQMLNALSQLSGEPGGGAQQTSLTSAGLFMGSVFDNAFGAQGGAGGQGGAPLGFAAQPKVSAAAQNAYAAVTPRDRRPAAMPSFEQRWSVWAAGYGGSSRVSGDSGTGSHDTTSRTYGVTAGATWRASPDLQLGFALGGAGSNFSVAEGFGSGKADGFNAALYGRYAFGPAYISAALGYSWQDATTDRTVTAGGTTEILHASFRPQALTTRLEAGRRFATSIASVTPYAGLQTTSLFMPSYSEAAISGTGTFALSYGSRNFTVTRGELGARFDKTMLLGDRPLTLKAKAAWAHDWNNDRVATASFQQLPGATFTMNGATPSANSALLSFGADLALSRGWTLGAGFDGEFSRTTASYSGKGSLRYSW